MKNERKIRVLSRVLRYLCIAGMVFMIVLAIVSWTPLQYYQIQEADWSSNFKKAVLALKPLLEETISYAFFWAILFLLARLLRLYERLEFFSKANVRYIRQIAILLLFSQLCYPFYTALRNYFLVSPGNNIALFLFMSAEFKLILLSLVIFLLGYIMEEGRYLEEEYKSTI